MSFKALELQHAIPRTQEMGRWQEQTQQRAAAEHQQFREERKRLDEAARTKAEQLTKSEQQKVKNQEESTKKGHDGPEQQAKGKSHEEDHHASSTPSPDPIRGHHIDISL
ncbi:hypothetical protein [Brevibacillus daliensis]|uniref:hypothetical protein n=1 Tax=Brevibacillus daliensis TaxID=2892995 RepID=UPI001E39E8CA|nr:hypothetical protein [Brevibacillus daliensis]